MVVGVNFQSGVFIIQHNILWTMDNILKLETNNHRIFIELASAILVNLLVF